MAVARYFSSVAQPTTLAGGISNANATMQVAATTGFPTSYPFTLSVDYGTSAEELVDVTNAAGTTLTITRAVDGTSAQSHSIGAVVRHVSSGRDFADFQTHAAATAGVHGVSGTLVGTSDAQTLANKTLTNPSISGATASGTWTGSPTFSGAPIYTGVPSLRATAAGTNAYAVRVTTDTQDRLAVLASGEHRWGTGSALFDTTMARTAAAQLTFGANVQVNRANTTDVGFSSLLPADGFERFRSYIDGKHEWGPGNVTRDTNLYRNSAGELKTDGALTVVGNLAAANVTTGAGSNWLPTWGTSSGLHLPTYGSASTNGSYFRVGRLIFFFFQVTFGGTTSFGTSATTSDNWNFSLPGGLTASAAFAGTSVPCGFGYAAQTGGATAPLQIVVDSGGTNFQLNTAGGRVDATSIANTGTIDSLTPWTWANGNALRFSGIVEVTT